MTGSGAPMRQLLAAVLALLVSGPVARSSWAPVLAAQSTERLPAASDSSGRLREFWNRRALGVGRFLTRADIDRLQPKRTVDLFRGLPGVRVGSGEVGRVESSRGVVSLRPPAQSRNGTCLLRFFVDGMAVSPTEFSIDQLTPDMVEAVEIYRGPAEVPARFGTLDSQCGAVVIWTRDPPARAPRPNGR